MADHHSLTLRAEEYIVAHLAEPVTIDDLCQQTGVSERTLYYAFHRVLGMSPKAFVKTRRLSRLRQDLESAAPDRVTVAEMGRRWGFWHTGNLAADYRRQFGELPSQTLAKSKPRAPKP